MTLHVHMSGLVLFAARPILIVTKSADAEILVTDFLLPNHWGYQGSFSYLPINSGNVSVTKLGRKDSLLPTVFGN